MRAGVEEVFMIILAECLLKLRSFSGNDGTIGGTLNVHNVVVVSEGSYSTAAIFLHRWHAAFEGYVAHSIASVPLPSLWCHKLVANFVLESWNLR